jgi:hypothetical protein
MAEGILANRGKWRGENGEGKLTEGKLSYIPLVWPRPISSEIICFFTFQPLLSNHYFSTTIVVAGKVLVAIST